MADIRKRNGLKGTTYQVRYPSKTTKSGYAYATFATLKESRAFRENSSARNAARPRNAEITTVEQAVQRWLDVCEHEGRDGRDPVSPATLAVYKGCATIMRAYSWEAQLHELESADLVAFRSWLLNECTEPQSAYTVLEGQVRQFAAKLGFAVEAEEPVWTQFPPEDSDDLALYEAVRGLSDHDLDQLDTLLSALVFGQEVCQRLDTGDSLFNRVARDLCVDMRYHWHPDRSFLERRTRDQLAAIAVDCGYAENTGRVATYKKSELVDSLLWFFDSVRAAAEMTPAQRKAREWLPDAMRFPAVSPDAVAEAEEEPDVAPWEDAA